MVNVRDFESRILLLDQPAIGRASFIELVIGDLGERWLESRKSFGSRLRAGEFFAVEREAAVGIEDGNDAALEVSALDRASGTPLAFQGEGVDVRARDFLQARDGVSAHALVRLGMQRAQTFVAAVH